VGKLLLAPAVEVGCGRDKGGCFTLAGKQSPEILSDWGGMPRFSAGQDGIAALMHETTYSSHLFRKDVPTESLSPVAHNGEEFVPTSGTLSNDRLI